MSWSKLIWLFISFTIPAFIAGQNVTYKFISPQYELEHIKLNNTEDPGRLYDITEDKQGFIWLTSNKGLQAFDGNHTFSYRNGSKLYKLTADSSVHSLYAFIKLPDGSLWIQEENSRMLHFDPVKRKLTESFTGDPINNELIYHIAGSNDGALFVFTINRAKRTIAIWKKSPTNKLLPVYQGYMNPNSYYSYRIAGNYHWIIEERGITQISLDGKEKKQYDIPTSPNYNIDSDDQGRFYFAGADQETIYTWNEEFKSMMVYLKVPAYLKGKGFNFFIKGNKIFFGGNLSLFIINREDKTIQDLSQQFIELAKKEAPNSLGVLFMNFFLRPDSSLLVCTQTDIYRLKKKAPTAAQYLQSVGPVKNITSILSFRALAEDEQKNIYASFYTGIAKQNKGEDAFLPMDVEKYMSGGFISTYSLSYWKGHLIWNNVNIDLGSGGHTFITGDKFAGHCTQWLQHDTLWLYQWNSNELNCYDLLRKKLAVYPIDKRISGNSNSIGEMNDMIVDGSGQNLWISSSDNGMALISKTGKLIRQYSARETGITENTVTDLELHQNLLWFGCKDGLGCLDIGTGKTIIYKDPYSINNGVLHNRTVFSILPDTTGNYYLGSSYGLLWFNVAAKQFYHLPDNHPMAHVEFNRGAAFKSSDNRYYFGSTDGLYSFTSPELEFAVTSNPIKPVKLISISIFDNRAGIYQYLSDGLDNLSSLMLEFYNNSLELSFSVPEFYKKVYYSYRVKGLSESWAEYKPENKISLYGLQPGKYLLEVKASTGLNDVNASYFSLPIVMKQVWYKRPWVILLFTSMAIVLMITYLRYRFNQKIKRQKTLADLRTKISSDLHDDVGSILSGLAMQSQMLAYTAKEDQKKSLLEISNMSRDAMEHMRDTVWAIDSRKDKYENLVDRMREYAEKNLALRNITHEFIITDVDTKKFIDPEKRQTIYLIFKEAITNIVKHSNGDHVIIEFADKKNSIQLLIRDNGTQKEIRSSDGLGMSNMKMRAMKIGGILTTKYENGFIVELAL